VLPYRFLTNFSRNNLKTYFDRKKGQYDPIWSKEYKFTIIDSLLLKQAYFDKFDAVSPLSKTIK